MNLDIPFEKVNPAFAMLVILELKVQGDTRVKIDKFSRRGIGTR
jgi:hypothetical protein